MDGSALLLPAAVHQDYPGPVIRPMHEIRLIEFVSEAHEGDICCRASVSPLLDTPLNYTALSYTWGSWDDCRTITLDGCPLRITHNLWVALRRLSVTCPSRRFWIDQVCINQHDSRERGHQVECMAEIFSRADKVFVWLGECSDDTLTRTITNSGHHPLRSQMESAVATTQPMWWTRAWVVQEFAVARDPPIICFGPHQIEWDIDEVPFKSTSETADRWLRDIAAVRDKRPANGRADLTLSQLGRVLARTTSSDPRDKVYSMLGLAIEGNCTYVNYDIAVSDVFERATFSAVQLGGYSILSLARPTFQSVAGLACWAVDFTFPHRGTSDGHVEFWNSRAIHNFQDLFTSSRTGFNTMGSPSLRYLHGCAELVLLGSVWDCVTLVVPLGRPKRPLKQKSWRASLSNYTESADERQFRFDHLQAMALADSTQDPYGYINQEMGDKQRGSSASNIARLNFWFALHLFNLWLTKWPTQARSSLAGDRIEIQRWTWYAEYQSNDLAFFITSRGFLGFGPSTIQPGDHVYLVHDYPKLMVVRPTDTKSVQFVSFAYVNGMTTAEQRHHATIVGTEEKEFSLV